MKKDGPKFDYTPPTLEPQHDYVIITGASFPIGTSLEPLINTEEDQ